MPGLGPRVRLREAAQARAAVDRLLTEIESTVVALTSRADLEAMPRHFAALGLARAARLCRAMAVLVDHDMADVAGLPMRPVFEAVLVSLYTLYGGEAAYEHVRGAYVRDLRQLHRDVTGDSDLVNVWDGRRDKIQWEDLCRTVGELMKNRTGEVNAPIMFREGYDLIYRGTSLRDIHAGVGAIGGHIVRGGDDQAPVGVARSAYTPDDGTADLLTAAMYVGLLGCQLLDAFGHSTARVRRLYDDLAAIPTDLVTAEPSANG